MANALNANQGDVPGKGRAMSLLGRFAGQFSGTAVPFEVTLPDNTTERFGQGAPSFHAVLKNARALRAVASMDEGRIGEAYLMGDIDIEGDMLRPFELRKSMKDHHFIAGAWRFIEPFIFGQVYTNKRVIEAHYDVDPEFFLSFLDPKRPCYSQGIYEHSDETLADATKRKFDYCYEKLGLKPGDHIIEVGPGWGAWFEYASGRGINCTGISISRVSIDYLNRRASELGYNWELIYSDLLRFSTEKKYDAVVIMGVIESLPQYDRVLEKCMSFVKPGGRIFIDGSANITKYEVASYISKYVFQGNHSFLVLHDFMEQLARTPLKLVEVLNDRYSYFLTFQQWARNFDSNRESVIQRFGDFEYRRFRLYLWGAAYEFLSQSLDCYRMVIEYPEP